MEFMQGESDIMHSVPRATEGSCRMGFTGGMGKVFIRRVLLLVLLLGLLPRAESAEWVPVTGKVMFGDTPLCAMVLANGQSMFSCSGDGSFVLNVPLDSSGMVTLQVFASGFAPFRQTVPPLQLRNFTVNMVRSDSDRQPTVNTSVSGNEAGWSLISGTIAEGTTPICAMVLANGQSMFSCNANLGTYSLDVPLDGNGEITLQIFVSGFQPFRTTVTGDNTVNLVYVFDTNTRQVQNLPPGGGTILLQDPMGFNFTLEVPARAISADTEFTLTRVESITNFPAGLTPLAAVRFEPSGLDFPNVPSLTVELPSYVRSGSPAIAFLSDDNGGNLSFMRLHGTNPAAAALQDLVVSLDIPHFSPVGIVEVRADAVLPPPPFGADAETRAQHIMALRIAEILNADGTIGGDDDSIIFEALVDWFENPLDGLRERAEALAITPDGSNLTSLLDLNGEMNRLLLEVLTHLGTEDDGSGNIFEAAIVETMADLVAAYLVELRSLCDTNTLDVQERLDVLSLDVVDFFISGDLGEIFKDEVFACQYEVTFTPDFQAAFVDNSVDIDYFIKLEDGTIFNGGISEIPVSSTVGAETLTIESITPTTITVTSALFGLGNVTVEIGAGPEATAEVLFVPSFIGTYGASGSGSASGCSDPEDAGPGSGAVGISFLTETLLSATRGAATIGISGVGSSVVTGIDLTVNLTDIEPNTATGTAFGGAQYRLVEVDDFGEVFVTVGSGSLRGSVIASTSGNTFGLDFDGGDNFCSSIKGTVLVASP